MTEKTAIVLNVNGDERAALAGPATTLLDALRDQTRQTGTKRGCSYGVCGACTVLVDGRAARACLMLAADCAGREIVTIEGLTDDPHAAALRAAMLEAGAAQCGYCTPGFVVALTELFRKSTTPPDTEAIRNWLGGNICRCTGYVSIVTAAARAAQSGETSQ
jgi:aerobic-type carbon monoxide dehydrogenase small subunit (CoxS/CutS family)